jgi:hypothetical protein
MRGHENQQIRMALAAPDRRSGGARDLTSVIDFCTISFRCAQSGVAELSACLVLTVLVFQVLAHRPGFPWWGLLLAAVAWALLRLVYLFLIDLLRR